MGAAIKTMAGKSGRGHIQGITSCGTAIKPIAEKYGRGHIQGMTSCGAAIKTEQEVKRMKNTHDFDSVFKTLKSRNKRLFIPVINEAFGKEYPMDAEIEVLPAEGFLQRRRRCRTVWGFFGLWA